MGSVQQSRDRKKQRPDLAKSHTQSGSAKLKEAAHLNVVYKENLRATQNSLDSNNNINFLDIDKLLLGIKQKNNSASIDLNSNSNNDNDNDNFPDIDRFLLGIKQKGVPASVNPSYSSTAEKVD